MSASTIASMLTMATADDEPAIRWHCNYPENRSYQQTNGATE